ncbi:hypothetical protein LINPERPRIM_LOCUS6847 [Linum perenne]
MAPAEDEQGIEDISKSPKKEESTRVLNLKSR